MNIFLCLTLLAICCQQISSVYLPNGCQEAFRNAALKAHNKFRAKHGAPALKRESSIDKSALAWSTYLAMNNKFEHSKSRYGENLYLSSGRVSSMSQCENFGTDCVNAWYSEIKNYNFNNPGFSMNTGHFTQVVWKSSRSIGLGIATGKGGTYCTAQYSPPGNYNGEFRSNVLPRRNWF